MIMNGPWWTAGEAEVIETINFVASAEDIAAGLVLETRPSQSDPGYGLIGYALLSIAAAHRDNPRFAGRGYIIRPRATITTNRDRIWSRDLPIRVTRDVAPSDVRRQRVVVFGR
jgi:hypothetical protein